jgi:hypothetical protein
MRDSWRFDSGPTGYIRSEREQGHEETGRRRLREAPAAPEIQPRPGSPRLVGESHTQARDLDHPRAEHRGRNAGNIFDYQRRRQWLRGTFGVYAGNQGSGALAIDGGATLSPGGRIGVKLEF